MGIFDDLFNGFLTGYLVRKLYNWIPGGVIAGAISAITIIIISLILVSFPFELVEGLEDIVCLLECFLSPIAVVLGAIGCLIVARIARHSSPETSLDKLTKLTGAAIGIGVGIVAGIILTYILIDTNSP